jgi:prolyl-tRNA editing enzyme YbaK/EbsC (Cys-tRNA(Pro) deacylase)
MNYQFPWEKTLQENGYAYQLLPQTRPLRSAEDGAAYFGIAVGQTAPVLLVESDASQRFLCLFAGDHGRLDLVNAAALLKVPKLTPVKYKKVYDITGFEPGNLPLFGMNLPCLFDDALLRYPLVYGGSGQENLTLAVDPKPSWLCIK